MSKRNQKKKRKSVSKIIVASFMALFVCVICVNFYSQAKTIYVLQQEEAHLNDQIEEKKKNLELSVNQDYYSSDAYIEKMATEKLGLVKPGEIEFINKSE